jgi:hypothetical protein
MSGIDPFDVERLLAGPMEFRALKRATVPAKIKRRRGQFIKVPWPWFEMLAGATGQTYRVALYLLHLDWKSGGKPFKLANSMLAIDGVSRQSKWRALAALERRGLIKVERRARRSPIIIHVSHP